MTINAGRSGRFPELISPSILPAFIGILLVLIPFVLHASSPERPETFIRGRIIRSDNRAPVAGARVTVPGLGRETRSREDGRFGLSVPDPSAGANPEFVLAVSAEGFDPGFAAVRPGPDEIEIALTPAFFILPGTRDVVVEAAGLDRPAFELPYAGRSLSRDDVLEAEANGLQSAVGLVPGVSFVGGGYHSAPSIRGVARNRVVLLVDGVRTASVRTIGGHLGFVHPFAVEAVEVIKGPFSTLYGHDAMAGVIQVETFRPTLPERGFAVRGGAFTRYETAAQSGNGAFSLSGATPKASFLVSYGRVVESDYRTGGGGVLPQSGFALTSVLAKAEVRPSDGHRFEAFYLRTDGRDIGKASGEAGLINVHPFEKNDIVSLFYEWTIGGPFLRSLESRLSRGLFTLSADFRTLTGPRTVQSLRELGEDGYEFVVKTTLTPGRRLVVFAGLDGYFQENQRITGTKNVFLSGPGTLVSSVPLNEVPEAATRDIGLFVQGTAALAEKWDLVFGVRGDAVGEEIEEAAGTRTRTFPVEANGNLGAVFKISPALRLSLNVGTAFRLPTPKDRYFIGQTPAGLNIGNPGLKPEHSLNTDLVLKFRSRPDGRLRFEGSLAAFVDRFRGLIVIKWDKPTGDRTGVFQNAGRSEIYGLEAEGTAATADGWTIYAAATALGAAVHGNDEVLDDLPPFSGILHLKRMIGRGSGWIGLEFRGAVAERRTSAGDLPAPAYLLADLSAGWTIRGGLVLRAAVENIGDASYREFFDLPSIRRKGRSLSLSLSAGF